MTTSYNVTIPAPLPSQRYRLMDIFAHLFSAPEFISKTMLNGSVMTQFQTRIHKLRTDETLGQMMEMSIQMNRSDLEIDDHGLTIPGVNRTGCTVDCEFPESWLFLPEVSLDDVDTLANKLWKLATGNWPGIYINTSVPQLITLLDPNMTEENISVFGHLHLCAQLSMRTWDEVVDGYKLELADPAGQEFYAQGSKKVREFLREVRDRQTQELIRRMAEDLTKLTDGWNAVFEEAGE